MRYHLVVCLLVGLSSNGFGAKYEIDSGHSNINFRIKHLLSKVSGSFTKFSGSFDYDKKMRTTGNFIATIDAGSIDTNNEKRDKHLRSADFFNVKRFPKIEFSSTKVVKRAHGLFQVLGNLTLLGKTKPVTIKFVFLGEAKDPWGNYKAGFEGKLSINRRDFGLTYNKILDSGDLLLGENVDIEILIEATNLDKNKKNP